MNSYTKFSTILVYSLSGTPEEMRKQLKDAERDVTEKVDQWATDVADYERWFDPDFGPRPSDPKGAKSIYRTGRRTRYSLPDHNTLTWMRPNYAGDFTQQKNNVFCQNATLFKDGHCSGDVIQGQLGDCWFISALAMIANEDVLLNNVFFSGGRGRKQYPDFMNPLWVEAGIWVIRFVSQQSFIYVVIDDQLPCNPKEKEKLVFGRCSDITELWVPLAEKACAKLFGSYDSLTGGFSQIALRDLTGLCPEAIDVNNTKVASPYVNDKLLNYLKNRFSTGSLLGASAANAEGSGEGKGAQGLVTGHAYSVLAVLPIQTTEYGEVNLVVIRNPWGSGEWTGNWSDKLAIKKKYINEIKEAWNQRPKVTSKNIFTHGRGKNNNVGEDTTMFDNIDNGVFCMDFKDFQKYFTEVIAAVDFPPEFRGRRIIGEWKKQNSGGNSSLSTWRINPSFKLTIPRDNVRCFIVLDQEDKRAQHGINFPDFLYAIAFRVVPGNFNFKKAGAMPTKLIPNCMENSTQISFGYSESCSIEVVMKQGDVYIVPSTYKVGEYGKFSLSVYCDCDDFELEDSVIIGQEEQCQGMDFGFRNSLFGGGGKLRHAEKGAQVDVSKRGHKGIQLEFDPVDYTEKRKYLQQLVRDAGHEPNDVARPYKDLPPEENTKLKFSELKEILSQYGVDTDKITKDIIQVLKGVDGKLMKSDIYEIFHDEKVLAFKSESKLDDIIPEDELEPEEEINPDDVPPQ